MNPYEILGIDKYASFEDIRNKYRQLASQNHPDKGGDTEKFKLINLAYDILSDPIKKKGFDDQGIFFTDSTTYTEAINTLQNLFNELINKHDPEKDNLIQSMFVEARYKKQYIEAQMESCLKSMNKLKKVRHKLKLKKQTDNHIKKFVESGLKNCEHDIQVFRRGIKIYDFVLVILNNYHYSEYEFMEMLNYEKNEIDGC